MRKIFLPILFLLSLMISKDAFPDSLDVRYKKAVLYLKSNEKIEKFILNNFEEYKNTFNIGNEIFTYDYFYYDDKYPEDYENEDKDSEYYFIDSSITNIVIGKRMSEKQKLIKLSLDPENVYHLYFSKIRDNEIQAELFYDENHYSRQQWFLGTGYVFRFTFNESNNLIEVEGVVMHFD